jgi:hypothetical protein
MSAYNNPLGLIAEDERLEHLQVKTVKAERAQVNGILLSTEDVNILGADAAVANVGIATAGRITWGLPGHATANSFCIGKNSSDVLCVFMYDGTDGWTQVKVLSH